ncbi:hypothetical protein SAMN04489737_1286 [Arcanobacterium phocae]|uniref:Uncharacterized protein n=1 Tax=Arcanobacterium phocae TaxID=131112 RepID=A0A1H2LIP6_9ACTO|nr:DUF5692 family protein [Arcanobacterium phocae]SDU80712.1 hypothetical protein SAMN04489737_1286 [Arcanobacterium phocae]
MTTFLGLWELGTPRLWIMLIVVFIAQVAVAEINRRWLWTCFAMWMVGGVLLIPYVAYHAVPLVGWFPVGKYMIMVSVSILNGYLVWLGRNNPHKFHRNIMLIGFVSWLGVATNIMEANIRDVAIYFNTESYNSCAADWQCLKEVNDSHALDMIEGLPETRNTTAALHSDEWYQEVAQNFADTNVGIDPETGFRTIGGWWNLASAAAGLLNIITMTGWAKITVSTRKEQKVKGLIWADMIWPWVIAYDLWNHAFLYNALADYTWYCTFALLLAATVPAFLWAKGQWLWFRCYTLMFWIAMNNVIPELLISPAQNNFATMNPTANIVCSLLALIANIALFVYCVYVVIVKRRQPYTTGLFQDFGAYRTIVKEHCSEEDKYWMCDLIKETPQELGFEPDSLLPPATTGFITHLPWWGKNDKRYPKLRTPVAVDPLLDAKGVKSDPQWDVNLQTRRR